MKFLKKYNSLILIIIGVLLFTAIGGIYLYLNRSNPHRKVICCEKCANNMHCMAKPLPKEPNKKENLKNTLDNLNTKSIISENTSIKDNLIHKPISKKPTITKENISKITSEDGTIEFSVDKLSVVPSIEAIGGIKIHLDKNKEKKQKAQKSK